MITESACSGNPADGNIPSELGGLEANIFLRPYLPVHFPNEWRGRNTWLVQIPEDGYYANCMWRYDDSVKNLAGRGARLLG